MNRHYRHYENCSRGITVWIRCHSWKPTSTGLRLSSRTLLPTLLTPRIPATGQQEVNSTYFLFIINPDLESYHHAPRFFQLDTMGWMRIKSGSLSELDLKRISDCLFLYHAISTDIGYAF